MSLHYSIYILFQYVSIPSGFIFRDSFKSKSYTNGINSTVPTFRTKTFNSHYVVKAEIHQKLTCMLTDYFLLCKMYNTVNTIQYDTILYLSIHQKLTYVLTISSFVKVHIVNTIQYWWIHQKLTCMLTAWYLLLCNMYDTVNTVCVTLLLNESMKMIPLGIETCWANI
jgi:hypothetical protein